MTKVEKLIAILNQAPQSEKQLSQRLGSSPNSVRSAISKARRTGVCIYLNPGKLDERGRQSVSKYRIGTPTKAMIATAYEFMGV